MRLAEFKSLHGDYPEIISPDMIYRILPDLPDKGGLTPRTRLCLRDGREPVTVLGRLEEVRDEINAALNGTRSTRPNGPADGS